MNLVGNTCVASYITRDYIKQPFVNPFVWAVMDFESCYNLVKYWDDINFKNYELVKNENWEFSIIIDGKVKVQYVHYKFSKEHDKIAIKNNDVYYNRIWTYIIEKYDKRIVNVRNEKPTFIFVYPNNAPTPHIKSFTLEQQKKLEELNSHYKIIISFKDMISSDKLICIKQDKNFKDNGQEFSRFIYDAAL